jgi:hypothetical protein
MTQICSSSTYPRAALGALALFAALHTSCDRGSKHEGSAGSASAGSTAASAQAATLARAEQAAKSLASRLRERLTDAVNHGGPTAAIQVCADEAQTIAAEVRRETGVALGRSSLRLRNPADAAPPWVEAWLAQQGERKAEGVQGIRTVTGTPSGSVARVLIPIAIEPGCLGCHGDRDSLAEGVRTVLEARYPLDRATGYAIGDLRGALWAEAPLSAAP